jgi:hypothetical protein
VEVVSDHPDAAYIKRDDIGLVIAKGMAVMYKVQPKNPVDFLAKWLLNYAEIEKKALAHHDLKDEIKNTREKHQLEMNLEDQEHNKELHAAELRQKKNDEFFKKVYSSTDLNNQLQELADYLQD